MGGVLGEGSFCTVRELVPQNFDDSSPNTKAKPVSLALKQPRNDLSIDDKLEAEQCVQNESQILSSIQHPNIIKMIGSMNGFDANSIVLELLQERTLAQKIVYWNKTSIRTIIFPGRGAGCHYPIPTRKFWKEKTKMLSEVASAMAYLHSQNIILRDLKPENCGFDKNGRLKVFDFGFATRLDDDKGSIRVGPDRYIFSEPAGTPRYMAPEMFQNEPYGKASDVYSFALLAWETLSLQKPYSDCSSFGELEKVVVNGQRPRLHKKWPQDMKLFITRSWSSNPQTRPSFDQIRRHFDIL